MPSPLATRGLPTFPPIPLPRHDIASMHASIMALKEAIELLTGQRDIRDQTQFSMQGMLEEIIRGDSRVYELSQVDQGLARRLTGVETTANGVSASGQIIIAAEGGSGGVSARFGVYLKVGATYSAGMKIDLLGAGYGVTTFYTDRFYLVDPGNNVLAPVFSYNNGAFTLTGSVTINGTLVINDTISTPKVQNNAITTSGWNNGGDSTSFQLYVRQGARIMVVGMAVPPDNQFTEGQNSGTTALRVNGGAIVSAKNTKIRIVQDQNGDKTNRYGDQFGAITLTGVYTAGGDGYYTFSIDHSAGVSGWNTVMVGLELAK